MHYEAYHMFVMLILVFSWVFQNPNLDSRRYNNSTCKKIRNQYLKIVLTVIEFIMF